MVLFEIWGETPPTPQTIKKVPMVLFEILEKTPTHPVVLFDMGSIKLKLTPPRL